MRNSILLGLILLVSPRLLGAQSTTQGPTDDQDEKRLADLERRNQELEARMARVEEEQALGRQESDYSTGMEISYQDLRATFQMFGDVGFSYEDPAPTDLGHSAFALGSVTLFANAEIEDSFRILSETVIDADPDGSVHADQERLWGAWTASDLLRVKVGVEHSPISRWNQLYHHGRWLETTIARPTLVEFEGSGGILPLHRTGIELSGAWSSDGGRVDYFGTVSNGRGVSPSDKQRSFDANDGKAVDLGLAFSPASRPDLRVGVSGTYDEIPSDPASSDPARGGSLRELIAMAQLQFAAGPVEVLGEFGFITHEARATDETFDNTAGYLQVACPRGVWTPYTRFDFRNMDEGDPFYSPSQRDLDLWRQIVGVRWDFASHLALKVELGYGEDDVRKGSSIDNESVFSAACQISWWL